MFGYVLPKSETVQARDYMMFQSAYCGICLETKSRFGNLARLTTNYDATVLALLVIEALRPKVEFATCRCIGDPRKKPYVRGPFMGRIADANILLCYYKIADDEADEGKRHRTMRSVLKKPYARAKADNPAADGIISTGYAKLREIERAAAPSLDRSADCFARLLEELTVCIIKDIAADKSVYYYEGETEEGRTARLAEGSAYMTELRALCYNIGKFVYLADALDDIEEDAKKHNYNPFLAVYPDFGGDRAEYIGRHKEDISFALHSTVRRAAESLARLPLKMVGDLLRNVVCEGLWSKAEELIGSRKKLPPPKLRLPKARAKEFNRKNKEIRKMRRKQERDKKS